MRKPLSIAAVALSASLALTACGGSKTETKATTAPSGATSSAPAASGAATPAGDVTDPSQCPTTSQQAFAKTRFVTNVGLAVAVSNQWIVKPYKAQKFEKGAQGRTATLIKAGIAGAFALKQLNDAKKNVQADPTLCKTFIKPLVAVTGILQNGMDKIKSGDVASIGALATGIGGLTGAAAASGLQLPTDVPKIPGLN